MKTYKTISIYDATIKKNRSQLIKLEDFNGQEEVENHIKKIREEQRLKNKMFRELQKITPKIESINNSVNNPVINNINNINILNTIDLKLDNNTGNTTCLLGSSKRGKTSCMMYLYKKYYIDDKDFISTLFSTNSHIKEYDVDKKLLKSNCFNKTSEKYIKLEKHINQKCKNKYKFLNMFDDIIDIRYKKLINDLILTYRNSNMSTIICMQYLYGVNKMIRANLNNILIFGTNNDEAAQDLIKIFLKPYFVKLGYKTYDQQIKLFKDVTANHGFFYIHPISDSISFHRLII